MSIGPTSKNESKAQQAQKPNSFYDDVMQVLSLDELKNNYPEEINFKYNAPKLRKELDERNIVFTEDERQIIFNLLSRGGIAAVQKGDIRFLIQILSEDKFKIQTLGRIKR